MTPIEDLDKTAALASDLSKRFPGDAYLVYRVHKPYDGNSYHVLCDEGMKTRSRLVKRFPGAEISQIGQYVKGAKV